MSDLISRDYLKHKIQHWKEKLTQEYGENDDYVKCLDDVIDVYIEQSPTVDAVEVVRCGKCQHWRMTVSTGTYGECMCDDVETNVLYTMADDFCSYGKRKEATE